MLEGDRLLMLFNCSRAEALQWPSCNFPVIYSTLVPTMYAPCTRRKGYLQCCRVTIALQYCK